MEGYQQPPRIPQLILSRFIPRSENTYLSGDFDEIFNSILERRGKRAADRWYWIQLFHWIPLILSHSIHWSIIMFKNYLKVTLRNLKRQKGYALINLAGLSVGITCALLIILVVQYEFKYESHHENAHRIYRINVEHKRADQVNRVTYSPVPLAETLKAELPEVTHFTRFNNITHNLMTYKDRKFYEDGVSFVDPGILEMFTFPMIAGDKITALKEPNSVVITERMAKKYFGNEDPLGKVLIISNSLSLQVTGVIRDHPPYSNFRPDFLISFATMREVAPDSYFQNWLSQQVPSYIMLADEHSAKETEAKIQEVFRRHVREEDNRVLHLDQLSRMHLFSDTEPTGNVNTLYILLAVGGLILLVACINYMNLSTARSSNRAKEVGLRKVVGAARQQLIRQFIGESMIYSAVSIVLAFVLSCAFLPVLNSLTGQSVEIGDLFNAKILAGVAGIFLLVGFLSGSYPALFLSAFRPAKVLRGTFQGGRRGALFRRILVVTQFAISIILIISTIIFGRQLVFLLNKPLGFEKDRMVAIRNDRNSISQDLQPFKSALLSNPRIGGVTGSLMLPSSIGMYNEVTWEGAVNQEIIAIMHNRVDYDFLDTYEIELVAGRNFSPEFPSDSPQTSSSGEGREYARSIIINQEAAKRFGWDDPIGKIVIQTFGARKFYFKVIGVIKDFHFNSLRYSITPLKLFLSTNNNRYISIKIQSEDMAGTLKFIEETWNHYYPNAPFDYFFLDRVFEQRYRSEASLKRLFEHFSVLAVFIGCLGLLGLAAYSAERRTKEIGIRKVLGASSPQIVMILSKEFSRWVLIASLIAWPIAYTAMNLWLNGFAYRINLNNQLILFVVAGAAALGIAFLTVGFLAVKAALADPVRALRYE
jgi:putative ABC transport system permease protein